MPVDIEEVLKCARRIVMEGKEANLLSTITPRMVREQIEKELSLESGELNECREEIKNVVKATAKELLDKESEDASGQAKAEVPSSPAEIPKKRKRSNEVNENAKRPKQESTSKPQSRKKATSSRQFKSLEMVPTSDMEQDEDAGNDSESTAAPPPTKPISQPSPSKKEPKVLRTLPLIPANPDIAKQKATPTPKPSSSRSKPVSEAKGHCSDSGLSDLFDEPPKRKQTRKSKEKSSAAAKPPRKRGSAATLSKEEETIKKLKSIVVACGVRKKWSKVFEGLDRPSQQIAKLREILAELGMEGRLTLEKAKAIKEKREFAQELEDVNEFNKTVNADPTSKRPIHAKKDAASSDTEEQNGTGSDSEVEVPVRRKSNARASIMAFLADQSDEE